MCSIITKFCMNQDSTAVMPCANFIEITWLQLWWEQNDFPWNLTYNELRFMKWAPGWYWFSRMAVWLQVEQSNDCVNSYTCMLRQILYGKIYSNSKIHGANMGPTWSRQDPGGSHVGSMNFAIWVSSHILCEWHDTYQNIRGCALKLHQLISLSVLIWRLYILIHSVTFIIE